MAGRRSLALSNACTLLVSLTLVLLLSHASMAFSQWTPVGGPSLGAVVAQATYAPDRVIVKLTPEAAMAVMGRGGKAVPLGLAGALARAKVREAGPVFADLWATGGGPPARAAEKAGAIRAQFGKRAARVVGMANVPDLENILALTLEPGASVWSAVDELEADPAVVYAEPDYLAHLNLIPNDTYYSSDQWDLPKISAPPAWDITTGSDSVVVGVVDTGLDFTHPDIAGRWWTNTGEIPANGIDDDGNGFVDDTQGWDFANNDNDPTDDHGHGSHVSGTIGAATNNSLGIAGICWQGKVMPVKAFDATGYAPDTTSAAALRYAADNGADVTNNSWGADLHYSQLIQDTVAYCYGLGCIVVAAAGNASTNMEYTSPAGLRDVASVAATDQDDYRAYFSNYGDRVDVSAPGCCIYSLEMGTGGYTLMAGTSMATPHVCGALALVLAAHPAWTNAQIVGQLVGTCDDIDSLNPGYEGMLGFGRINLYQALSGAPSGKRILVTTYSVDDSLGDGDGFPEPGERISLAIALKHFTGDSTNVTATLTTSEPDVTIVDGDSSFGGLSGWCSADNAASPFVFDIDSEWPGDQLLEFTVTITADGGYSRQADILVPPPMGFYWYLMYGFDQWRVWDQTGGGDIGITNLDDFTWQADAGYQLRPANGHDTWGVTSLPLTADLDPGQWAAFGFEFAAPPATTLGYVPPVTPEAEGAAYLGEFDFDWQFCLRWVPLVSGPHMVARGEVARFPDILPATDGAWAAFWVEECAGRVPLIVTGYPEPDGTFTYRPTDPVDRGAMAVYMSRALKLETGAYEGRFSDVLESHWAWPWIEALVRADIVAGYPDGTYRPSEIVNRGQMAVYVARGIWGGMDVPTGPDVGHFPDVPDRDPGPGHWAYDEVEFAVAHGVVQGYPDGTYRPDDAVTRDQMAVFVYRGFIMPTGVPVVLGGPAITRVNPATADYWGWSSIASGPAADPGYAYVIFDAVRWDTNLGGPDSFFDVFFELRGPVTPTHTVSLSAEQITTAKEEAMATGVAYYAVPWDIPVGLPPGDYTLVVSVSDETDTLREIARQPSFTITP